MLMKIFFILLKYIMILIRPYKVEWEYFIDYIIPIFAVIGPIITALITIKYINDNTNKQIKAQRETENRPILFWSDSKKENKPSKEDENIQEERFAESQVFHIDGYSSGAKKARKIWFKNAGKGPAINIKIFNLKTDEEIKRKLTKDLKDDSDYVIEESIIIPAEEKRFFCFLFNETVDEEILVMYSGIYGYVSGLYLGIKTEEGGKLIFTPIMEKDKSFYDKKTIAKKYKKIKEQYLK